MMKKDQRRGWIYYGIKAERIAGTFWQYEYVALLKMMPNTFTVLAMTCDESELWVKLNP
jgi:hypothetical protein